MVNELFATVFANTYGFKTVGLRYFNIFGKRQDSDGVYAAVIPKWVGDIFKGEEVFINGIGDTSRDFCYIDNTVQMNLSAATTVSPNAVNQVYNTALSDRTSLNQLYGMIQDRLINIHPAIDRRDPTYQEFRESDVRHSQADITKAKKMLGYEPTHKMRLGLDEAMEWYVATLS